MRQYSKWQEYTRKAFLLGIKCDSNLNFILADSFFIVKIQQQNTNVKLVLNTTFSFKQNKDNSRPKVINTIS
jgi:hypothetical protein